jgi:hypothetical protein
MTTTPYELLARFNKNGTIAGVSVRTITTVNGRDYESDPQPLSGASDPAFAAFASQFSAAVVAERNALAADKTALTGTLATRTTELATMTADRDSQQSAKESALADVTRLAGELADANELLTSGHNTIEQIESERDAALAEIARLEALLNPVNPPLIPTTVIRRAGSRWTQLRQQSQSDAYLATLMDWIVAAREVLADEPIFSTGVRYAIQQEYVTQAEIDAWFAPVATP